MYRVFLCLLLAPFAYYAAADTAIDRGKLVAATCNACHQSDGMGMHLDNAESWPRLAGLNADYIIKQLHDFKSGARDNASMKPFANMLNKQQIHDVAHYFSSLKSKPLSVTADDALLEKGKKLALEGDWDRYIVPCSKCHGSNNQGNGQHFPGIAGQQVGYLQAQLKAFKSGKRSNDAEHLMQAIAKRLNADDIQALSAYLASQPAGEPL